MLKKSLCLAALIYAGAAQAQWLPVAPAESGVQFFIDATSIRRTAGMTKVWELMNTDKADGEGVRSSRFQVEYDCAGKRSRGLEMLTFGQAMAAGQPLRTMGPDPDGWEAVPPDSIYDKRMKIACTQ